MLELMRTEFEGEVAGPTADLTNMPQILIDFLIKEAGENPNNAIAFLNKNRQTAQQVQRRRQGRGRKPKRSPSRSGGRVKFSQ